MSLSERTKKLELVFDKLAADMLIKTGSDRHKLSEDLVDVNSVILYHEALERGIEALSKSGQGFDFGSEN